MNVVKPSPSPAIRQWTVSPHVADLVIEAGRVVYRDAAARRTRVAICGSGGTHYMPWDDPTVECWAINNFWNEARDSLGRIAASRWWEQHQIQPDVDGPHAGLIIQNENDMRWINTCPVPLYTTEPWPANPNAVVWPIDAMALKYRDYFTCTFAMQIVQALDEGFEELIVCGLELLRGTKREATFESSCVNYWLGYAEGRGMRVTIPNDPGGSRYSGGPQFLLMHPYRYGHEYWLERRWVEEYIGYWERRPLAI